MTYFDNSSCFFFLSYKQKQPKNTVNRIFPITHNTLIQPVASLIQHILHFGQYKIKPYSPLQVSMMSLQNFFTSSPMCHLTHFPYHSLVAKPWQLHFMLSHWSPEHMAHYHFPLAHYHSRNLHNLTCLCNVKITCYTTKTLLDFVEFVSSTLPHYICFTTVFPCTYLMHFVSKLNQLRDYLC